MLFLFFSILQQHFSSLFLSKVLAARAVVTPYCLCLAWFILNLLSSRDHDPLLQPPRRASHLAPLTSHLIFHTPTTATPTSTACHCLETPQPPSTFTNPARPSKPLTDSSFRNSFDAGVRHQQPSPLVSPFAFATAIDSLVSCEFSVSILSLFIFRPSFASTTFAASPLAHTQFKRCFSPLRQHLVFVSSSRRRGSFQSGVHPSQI